VFLRNVGEPLPDCVTSHPRKHDRHENLRSYKQLSVSGKSTDSIWGIRPTAQIPQKRDITDNEGSLLKNKYHRHLIQLNI
jgi:hypothetical protein